MTEFTIEVYKTDKRKKEGKRLVERVDIVAENREMAEKNAELLTGHDKKMFAEVHETWNEVRNIMSGKIVKEHYTTPYYCSVGSETYFCS